MGNIFSARPHRERTRRAASWWAMRVRPRRRALAPASTLGRRTASPGGEDEPTLIGYDETAFSKKLYYDQLDPQLACDVFEKNRLLTAEILRRLPEAVFARIGNHNERGRESLATLLETYIDHLDHHLKFIHDKRRLLGSPL